MWGVGIIQLLNRVAILLCHVPQLYLPDLTNNVPWRATWLSELHHRDGERGDLRVRTAWDWETGSDKGYLYRLGNSHENGEPAVETIGKTGPGDRTPPQIVSLSRYCSVFPQLGFSSPEVLWRSDVVIFGKWLSPSIARHGVNYLIWFGNEDLYQSCTERLRTIQQKFPSYWLFPQIAMTLLWLKSKRKALLDSGNLSLAMFLRTTSPHEPTRNERPSKCSAYKSINNAQWLIISHVKIDSKSECQQAESNELLFMTEIQSWNCF